MVLPVFYPSQFHCLRPTFVVNLLTNWLHGCETKHLNLLALELAQRTANTGSELLLLSDCLSFLNPANYLNGGRQTV